MSDEKPSTNDILSKIRAQKAAAAGGGSSGEQAAPEASAAESAAKPAAAPKSPADILAAVRAGGGAKSEAAAKPAAGPAPSGTAGIMAAIRGGGAVAGGAAAAAPASAPVGAPAKVDPAAAAGMSPADMIRAARAKTAGVADKPSVALPTKPLAAKAIVKPAAKPAEILRRTAVGAFFAWLFTPVVLAFAALGSAVGALSLGTARFMMSNVLVEPPTKFKIGPPGDYAPGTVSTKWQAQFNIWVVNAEVEGAQILYALSTVCTHLGCTPNWLEGEQKFKCPCHGSGFYKNGVNFEGPAPRPLERVGLRLAEDGNLEVDKSVKFQKELGQWANPASYVPV